MIIASSVEVVSHNLKLTMHMPSAVSGVIPFINQFTRVWAGTIKPAVFQKTFNDLKSQVLPWLADLSVLEDDSDRRIGHKLELCHTALNYKWNSPATATVCNDGDIFWESGQSRFLAGGLCWPNPWIEHKLILFAPTKSAVESWISDPSEIVSDLDLLFYLGNDSSHAVNTRLDVFDQQISYKLSSISRIQNAKEKKQNLHNRVDAVRQWVKLYPRGTILNVHTSNPTAIIDSIGYWNINYLSLEQPIAKEVHTVRSYKDQNLDLAELLVWMDKDYSNFNTADGGFLLSAPGADKKTKTIALSCL